MNKPEDHLLAISIYDIDCFNRIKHIPDLFVGKNKIIFDEMNRQVKFTESTLFEAINNNKLMSIDDFLEITNILPIPANFDLYLNTVLLDYIKRGLTDITVNLKNYNRTVDLEYDIKNIFEKLDRSDNKIKTAKEVCVSILENLHPHKTYSMIDFIDDKQGGYSDDELILLAARPGVGKTSKALELIRRQIKNKIKVGFITAEMSSDSVMRIMACSVAGINKNKLDKNMLSNSEWESFQRALEYLYECEIYFDESKDIESVLRKIKIMKRKYNIDIVYVDHLHHLQTLKSFYKEYDMLKYITGELKESCRQLKIPHVVLAQLNRGGDTDADPVPKDLRGCGSLEEYADIILLMKEESKAIDGNANMRKIKVIVSKNRNGEQGVYYRIFLTDVRRYKKTNEVI